jgi:hypothetical protein
MELALVLYDLFDCFMLSLNLVDSVMGVKVKMKLIQGKTTNSLRWTVSD